MRPRLHSEHHNRLGTAPVNARTHGRSLRTVSQMCHAFAEPGGHGRTLEDPTYVGFGTVRPRVQIPGPQPFLYSKPAIFRRRPEPTCHSRVTISLGTIAT